MRSIIVLLACYVTAHVYDEFAPKLVEQVSGISIVGAGVGLTGG